MVCTGGNGTKDKAGRVSAMGGQLGAEQPGRGVATHYRQSSGRGARLLLQGRHGEGAKRGLTRARDGRTCVSGSEKELLCSNNFLKMLYKQTS